MVVGWLATAFTGETTCEVIDRRDILDVPAPAIVVLGERRGTQPDLWRAAQVVRGLQKSAAVTVAVEAVRPDKQTVLDDFAAHRLAEIDLWTRLEWEDRWGFRYRPYAPLVTASERGAKVVAAGPPPGPPPAGAAVTVPTGYFRLLEPGMAGRPVPPEAERGFVRTFAWHDQSIAEAALAGWDGQGYLVIVADRARVEGGKGVTWQLDRRSEVPVHAFTLAWGGQPPCQAADKVWGFDPITG